MNHPHASTATNSRLLLFKATLWFLVGAATSTGIARLVMGLGATSALSDAVPWGLWKGFNVLACVPMAAGGFVIAGLVHCLQLRRYHAIVRPTVLIAFLGYMTAVTGLLLDIGKPWNIWRPIFYWNVHSPLFEVAWCIMLYATVMLAEFAPVIGEKFGWGGFAKFMHRLTPALAVLAVAISTLHQSTLGTLFVLSPERLHPLWFSPILNLLFLSSAIGMGLGFLCLQFLLVSWLYRREAPWEIIRGLARTAAWVLGVYLVLRLGDLIVRGQIGHAFTDGHWAGVFWLELLLSTVLPILLFVLPGSRGRGWALTWGCIMTVFGVMLQRLGVGAYSQYPVVGFFYVPTLSEIAITLGVVALLGLVFLYAVENLKVWQDMPAGPDHFTPPAVDPVASLYIRSPWLGGHQRGSLAWIAGAVIGLAIVEVQVPLRVSPRSCPVDPARNVFVVRTPRQPGPGHLLQLADLAGGEEANNALMIAGGSSQPAVLFEHDRHQERLGGKQSCLRCHHRNLPLEVGTPCSRCHRDMYHHTDTFSHQRHVAAHGDAASCVICHQDPSRAKSRVESRGCDECHKPAKPADSLIQLTREAPAGVATGYQAAMHGLCLECHRSREAEQAADQPYLSLCSTCHTVSVEPAAESRRRASGILTAAVVEAQGR